jgi:hypothetical protein
LWQASDISFGILFTPNALVSALPSCVCVCMCVCVCACVCVCLCVCVRACMQCICAHINTHTCIHAYLYVHTHKHTCMHPCIHTYIHTGADARQSPHRRVCDPQVKSAAATETDMKKNQAFSLAFRRYVQICHKFKMGPFRISKAKGFESFTEQSLQFTEQSLQFTEQSLPLE